MKKLIIVLCLMFLCTAVFNARVYAVFITDITEFVQFDGTDTFTDTFGDDVEPPSGPITSIDYFVFGTFDGDEESGGSLALDNDDGILDEGEMFLSVDVINSSYFFVSGVAGSVTGLFDFSGGLPSGSFFDIEILNFASASGEISGGPLGDEAWMGVFLNDSGHLIGEWGDDSQEDLLGSVDFGVVDDTTIGLKLEIDSVNNVTALFDYGGSGFISHTGSTDFTTLSFTEGIYTGAFGAGVEPIPEPATIALLGIGLVGLAGAAARRKLKRKR